MGKKPIYLFAALAVFLFAGQSFSQTDGYTRMYGFSSRAAAMGGAMVGIAEGIDALAYNPAALALTKDSFTLQVQTFPDAELMVNDVNCAPGSFGVIAGLTKRVVRDRIGLGFTFTQSAGGGGGGPYSWPSFGGPSTFNLLGGGAGVGPIQFGVALKLHDTLGIGVMPTSNIWIRSSPINIAFGQLLESILGTSIGAPATDVNPNIGIGLSLEDTNYAFSVAWRPLKYLSLGYETIPITKMRIRIPIVIAGGGVIDDVRSMVMSDIQTSPPIQQYGVGIHIPIPHSKLTLAWSQQILGFKKLYDDLYEDFLRYSNPMLSDATGIGYGAPGKMDDAIINRFGGEWLLNLRGIRGVPGALDRRNATIALRGGYFKWNSPYPEGLRGHSFDNDADIYSGGLGFAFDRLGRDSLEKPLVNHQFAVNMHVQYLDLESKNYKLEYDYWGRPKSAGDLYYFETKGQIWALGLEFTWLH